MKIGKNIHFNVEKQCLLLDTITQIQIKILIHAIKGRCPPEVLKYIPLGQKAAPTLITTAKTIS